MQSETRTRDGHDSFKEDEQGHKDSGPEADASLVKTNASMN